jgi:hypothetical protein
MDDELMPRELTSFQNIMVFELRDPLEPLGRLDLMAGVQGRVEAYDERLGVDPADLEIQRRRIAALGSRDETLVAHDLAVERAGRAACAGCVAEAQRRGGTRTPGAVRGAALIVHARAMQGAPCGRAIG